MLSSSRKAACVQFNWHRLKCVVTSLFVTCTGTAGALMGTFMWRKWNTDVHILMSSVAAATGSSLCPTLSPYRRCVSLFTHKHWVVQSPYSCALPWMRWSLSLSSVLPAGFPDDRWWSQEGGQEGGELSVGEPRGGQEGGELSDWGSAGGCAESAAQLETLRWDSCVIYGCYMRNTELQTQVQCNVE